MGAALITLFLQPALVRPVSGDGPSPLAISLREGQGFRRRDQGRRNPVTREAKLKRGLVQPCGVPRLKSRSGWDDYGNRLRDTRSQKSLPTGKSACCAISCLSNSFEGPGEHSSLGHAHRPHPDVQPCREARHSFPITALPTERTRRINNQGKRSLRGCGLRDIYGEGLGATIDSPPLGGIRDTKHILRTVRSVAVSAHGVF